MLLTEELGSEAVWVINNGVSHWQDVPTDQIGPWVESALESIEFVTGGGLLLVRCLVRVCMRHASCCVTAVAPHH